MTKNAGRRPNRYAVVRVHGDHATIKRLPRGDEQAWRRVSSRVNRQCFACHNVIPVGGRVWRPLHSVSNHSHRLCDNCVASGVKETQDARPSSSAEQT